MFKRMTDLTKKELNKIYRCASMEVLRDVGVAFNNIEATDILKNLGSQWTVSPGIFAVGESIMNMMGIVKRLMPGMEISSTSLTMDVVEAVGPAGNFLMHEHTLANYRSEARIPLIGTRAI